MAALSIDDLNKAKQNTDFIEKFTNSENETELDRLGRERTTLAGVEAYIGEHGILGQTLTAEAQTKLARDQALALINSRDSVPIALADSTIPVGGRFAAPLADGSWQAYTKTSTSVATAIGGPMASAAAVAAAPQATMSSTGSIVVDLTAKTINVAVASTVLHKSGVLAVPTQTVSFAASDVALAMYLWVDLTTKAVGMAVAPSVPPVGTVVLGLLVGQRFYGNDPAGKIVVRPTGNVTNVGHAEPMAAVLGTTVGVNQNTLLLTTSGSTGYVLSKRGFTTVPANQSVAYTVNGALPNGLSFLYVDPITGVLGMTVTAANPPSGFPIIAAVYFQQLYKLSCSQITYTNAAGDSVLPIGANSPSDGGVLTEGAALTVNLQAKTLTSTVVTAGLNLMLMGENYVTLAAQTVSFTLALPTGLLWVYADRRTGALGAVAAPAAVPAGKALLCWAFNGKLYAPMDVRKRITLIDGNGLVVSDDFSQDTQRMILPDVAYFLPNTPLALFKAPSFSDFSDVMRDVSFWLDTKGTSLVDRFQPIRDVVKLDPAQLGATFELGFRHKAKPDNRYIKSITRRVASAGALSGRALKILAMGDSLTEGGMVSEFKAQLEAQGATVTPVGTYFSSLTNNLRGEGRGFWNYRSFIGKDNYTATVGPHTRSTSGTDTTKFENPFLKTATTTDKANHPTWCFRFTGVDKELSYADDPDKTGDFYIFDFAWYRAQHSVPAPDAITIALSTNDINLDLATYPTKAERLALMRLALQIMVRQIRVDLPTVKIGIVPAPAWGSTSVGDSRWFTEVSEWIENCMVDVAALNTELGNVTIIPVWPFMSEDWIFPYASSATLSAFNNTQVKTITDWIHFDAVGKSQYGAVFAAWAANVL